MTDDNAEAARKFAEKAAEIERAKRALAKQKSLNDQLTAWKNKKGK